MEVPKPSYKGLKSNEEMKLLIVNNKTAEWVNVQVLDVIPEHHSEWRRDPIGLIYHLEPAERMKMNHLGTYESIL